MTVTRLAVPFGLLELDGRLYEPEQVALGKRCGCVCPACRQPLIARHNVPTPHFAHAPGADCPLALETALHFATKQLITEEMKIRLPEVRTPASTLTRRSEKLYAERTVPLKAVELEVRLDGVRPDIVATLAGNGGQYLVEIAVTHFTEEWKVEKLRRHDHPAFEVDVSSLKDNFTFENLALLLYRQPYPAKWLYHPSLDAWQQQEAERVKARTLAVATMAEQEREFEAKRDARFLYYCQQSQEEKLGIHCRKLGISLDQMMQLCPEVAGEQAFGVYRAVWQSAALVYIQQEHNVQSEYATDLLPLVSTGEMLNWMARIFRLQNKHLAGQALGTYLQHLENLNLLRHSQKDQYLISTELAHWLRGQFS